MNDNDIDGMLLAKEQRMDDHPDNWFFKPVVNAAADKLYSQIEEQILRLTHEAIMRGESPVLEGVITHIALRLFEQSIQMRMHIRYDSRVSGAIQFNGCRLTPIPGEDVFFHIRQTHIEP